MKKWLFLIFGCIIVLLITRWMVSRGASVEVEVFGVEVAEFISQVDAWGAITSRKIITLHAKSNGIIQKVPAPIQAGAKVSKGEFLGEVKTSEEETQTIQNELKRAETELEISKRKVALSKQLFELKAISENELMREKLNYESQKISVQELKEKLMPQKLSAPFSSVISEMRVKNGEIVKRDDPLFTFCDMEHLIAELDANEKDVARIHNGQEVLIMSEAFSEELNGRVERVSMIAKQGAGTPMGFGAPAFSVTVSIENPSSTVLRIGGHVLGRVITQRKQNAIGVPLEAVLYDGESNAYLFVYNSGKAKRREVKIGLSSNELVEIVDGLKPGEKVIISNNLYLKNNTSVILKEPSIPFYEGF
ncbi:efflux RND transporter periplasmic adaptor subunit [candidate division WOR-3 bacterium]|nr:efflux RND transporter periplasmic adaptor subunit [candidate division WOR-3 bacterium]